MQQRIAAKLTHTTRTDDMSSLKYPTGIDYSILWRSRCSCYPLIGTRAQVFFGVFLWVISFGQLHIWWCFGYHMKSLRLGFPTMCLASQTDKFIDFGVNITLHRDVSSAWDQYIPLHPNRKKQGETPEHNQAKHTKHPHSLNIYIQGSIYTFS